jgi:hypothetical protein
MHCTVTTKYAWYALAMVIAFLYHPEAVGMIPKTTGVFTVCVCLCVRAFVYVLFFCLRICLCPCLFIRSVCTYVHDLCVCAVCVCACVCVVCACLWLNKRWQRLQWWQPHTYLGTPLFGIKHLWYINDCNRSSLHDTIVLRICTHLSKACRGFNPAGFCRVHHLSAESTTTNYVLMCSHPCMDVHTDCVHIRLFTGWSWAAAFAPEGRGHAQHVSSNQHLHGRHYPPGACVLYVCVFVCLCVWVCVCKCV